MSISVRFLALLWVFLSLPSTLCAEETQDVVPAQDVVPEAAPEAPEVQVAAVTTTTVSGLQPVNDDHVNEKLLHMLERGNAQPKPLIRSGNMFEQFFEVMATLWHIADEYDLIDQIQFTNFVTFGPQSAGKTTITERILGFPVSVTKSGIGTTRPMVLTTRRSSRESVKVKVHGDVSFVEYERKDVMLWAQKQMTATGLTGSRAPRISNKPIYIDVTGPGYMNRRFVDLPGFQSNDEGNAGTREAILDLLREEMEKPNTVVLCVEDSQLEYVNSPLILAIEQVFGQGLLHQPSFLRRFVVAFNKSDKWLMGDDVTKESFVNRIYPYVEGTGLMPIIMGTPFDPNRSVRREREAGTASFDDVVEEYRNSDGLEEEVYRKFFSTVDIGSTTEYFLRSKFLGFNSLLGTVDAMVVERDLGNFERISRKLLRISDKTAQAVSKLELKREILLSLNNHSKIFITDLLYDLKKIATTDAGGGPIIATIDIDEIRAHGNNALEEEIEFAFGRHDDNATFSPSAYETFGGYYDPDRTYRGQSVQGLDHMNLGLWKREVFSTVDRLKSPAKTHSIDYLKMELVGGKLYERAVAVWSSSLYSFLAPTEDDLLRLANIVGTNTEIKDPHRHDFLKATRLMEVYVMRLVPALHYLCQKLEFLLLKIFDTAWRSRRRTGTNKELLEVIGEAHFRTEARTVFRDSIRKSAAIAYGASLSDLNNDISKLLPYATDSAAVSGMLFAFPETAESILNVHTEYRNVFAKAVKTKVIAHMSDIFLDEGLPSVLRGIEDGIDVITMAGSIDPLLVAGLGTCREMVWATWKRDRAESQRGRDERVDDERMEERDERLLGFTCVLYSHFLPRFIATIDSRMRRDLWASVDDTRAIENIRESVIQSNILRVASAKVEKIDQELGVLKMKEAKLRDAYERLTDLRQEFQGYLPVRGDEEF